MLLVCVLGMAGWAQHPATTSIREATVHEERAAQPEAAGDYEYDEAHDAVDPAHATSVERRRTEPARTDISTGPDDQGGDYGYDMAHDVPR
ncbi:MAG: hypothetical protein ICV70_06435 [Jiangellaceae bacterium]|nr:hypothetical protein [Jiangellaceae bacterium]